MRNIKHIFPDMDTKQSKSDEKRKLSNDEKKEIRQMVYKAIKDTNMGTDEVLDTIYQNTLYGLNQQLEEVVIYPKKIPMFKQIIYKQYCKSRLQYGDMIGCIAATAIAEPSSQANLSSFHYAGVLNISKVLGMPRFKELSMLSRNPKMPSMALEISNPYIKVMVLSDVDFNKDESKITFDYVSGVIYCTLNINTKTLIINNKYTGISGITNIYCEKNGKYISINHKTKWNCTRNIQITDLSLESEKIMIRFCCIERMKEYINKLECIEFRSLIEKTSIFYVGDNSMIHKFKYSICNKSKCMYNSIKNDYYCELHTEKILNKCKVCNNNCEYKYCIEHNTKKNEIDYLSEYKEMTICKTYYKMYDTLKGEDYKKYNWCIRYKLSKEQIYKSNIDLEKLSELLEKEYHDTYCVWSPNHIAILDVYVDTTNVDTVKQILGKLKDEEILHIHDENKDALFMQYVAVPELAQIVIAGIPNITRAIPRKASVRTEVKPLVSIESKKGITYKEQEQYTQRQLERFAINDAALKKKKSKEKIEQKKIEIDEMQYIIDTEGSSIKDVIELGIFNNNKIYTTNVWEIYETFGIAAFRDFLNSEFDICLKSAGYINQKHLDTLSSSMANLGKSMSITRFGQDKKEVGPMARATFEEPIDNLMSSAFKGTVEYPGVSLKVILGQVPKIGTGLVELKPDLNMMMNND